MTFRTNGKPVDFMVIYNGYQKSQSTYYNNCRPRDIDKVVRGKDPDLDKEAKQVVKTLKKFTPGKMNGNPVNVWYTLPVTFNLPENIR